MCYYFLKAREGGDMARGHSAKFSKNCAESKFDKYTLH